MPTTQQRTSSFHPVVPVVAHRRGQGRVRTIMTAFAIAVYAGLIVLARLMPNLA
jgi:hypothetical protein